MNAEHALEFRDLCKEFRALSVLEDLSFQLPKGSLCALLGPNGCGKTTALRIVLGLIQPDSGVSKVLGKPSNRIHHSDFQRIGYVAEGQDYPKSITAERLFDWCRSVYENWDTDFVSRLVRDFEIPLHTRLERCSRGQRMKALLVSSIGFRPELLILDEPLGGLDPVHREEFGEALTDIGKVGEWSMMISSHDVDDIETLVDRVVMMGRKKQVVEEDLDSLLARFKRVEVLVDSEVYIDPYQIPVQWHQLRRAGRRISLVDSQFDEASCSKELERLFGKVQSMESKGLTLKEIYVALARKTKGKKS
ncbi:MAG: ABC transporter ATP-binding protein [Verrucomicrobiota bacterium]